MLTVLEGFHHPVVRRNTGMTAKHGAGGEWEHLPVVAVLEAAGLHPIMEYIRRRHATIAGKLICLPIYEFCIETERIPGTSRMMIWWDQDVVNEPEQ